METGSSELIESGTQNSFEKEKPKIDITEIIVKMFVYILELFFINAVSWDLDTN